MGSKLAFLQFLLLKSPHLLVNMPKRASLSCRFAFPHPHGESIPHQQLVMSHVPTVLHHLE